MSNIWLFSDPHFCHNKPFLYEPRGFSSIEEMNETIIQNWNEVVQDEDTVYLLGDLMLDDKDGGICCLKQLRGHIHAAIGNHDSNNKIELYKSCPNIEEITMGYRLIYRKYIFILSHYPTLVANFEDKTTRKIWNIHGHDHDFSHFHSNLPHCFDVCPEANQNYPIHIDTIIELIRKEAASKNS